MVATYQTRARQSGLLVENAPGRIVVEKTEVSGAAFG
jgi:hypothetical protein